LPNGELIHAGLEKPLEGLERLEVLRRGADDLAVGLDGLFDVVQPHLIDVAEAVLELEDLVRALTDLRFLREDFGELAPALGLREEPIERTNGALVLGIHLEDAAIPRNGAVDALELYLVHLGDAQPELHEALRLIGEFVELAVVQTGDRRPALRRD